MKLSVGETIRALRRRDGRTQEALAEALGVTGQAVSRWEAGGSYPDLELIPAIAHFLGVTIDELFGYTSERDKNRRRHRPNRRVRHPGARRRRLGGRMPVPAARGACGVPAERAAAHYAGRHAVGGRLAAASRMGVLR
ncbi:MAG: helix-turn-helix transcriptional regulator [Acutalibacteraceae bacterium]